MLPIMIVALRIVVVIIRIIMVVIVVSRSLLCLHGLLSGIASSGCLVSEGLCCGGDGCGTVAPCPIDMRCF